MVSLKNMAKQVLSGSQLEQDKMEAIAKVNSSDLNELLYWADRIREHFFGRRVNFCVISPGRKGGCTEDCAWCGQSAHHASDCDVSQAGIEELLPAARNAYRAQSSCFCVVNSGCGPAEQDIDLIEKLNCNLVDERLPHACASLGELNEVTARRLAAAGVKRYNHNLETSKKHFANVVGTHEYEDRLRTLHNAKAAGMSLCTGGIFGIGETWADRVELALTLRDLEPEVVPLNFLDARPGTALANVQPLAPLECLHIIALFRFALPTINIKIAGGRHLLRDLQGWVFKAGATSLMVGDYLTTKGRSIEMDIQMVSDLNMELLF